MIYQFTAEQTEANLNFDIRLEKQKQVYCFISENGVGKTNLLENMAKTLLYAHSMFRKKQLNLKYSGLFDLTAIQEKLSDLTWRLPVDLYLNEKRIKDKRKVKWTTTRLEDMFIALSNAELTFDEPLVFIGAKDRGYTENIDRQHVSIIGDRFEVFAETFSRLFTYITGGGLKRQEVADWFTSRIVLNPKFVSKYEARTAEVITVLKLIQSLEPAVKNLLVEQDGETRVNLLFQEGKLLFDNIPLDKLSTGFVAIIKIFQEIVAGYGGWTGLIEETDIQHVKGVVFIDELEAHLHPRWQQAFIPLLKQFFPATTFYIATHSPLIVSTTDEGEAYELRRHGNDVAAEKLGNPQEWYLADLFSQGFHVDFSAVKKGGNGRESLADRLQRFSVMVKDYSKHHDEALKSEIDRLYQAILPSLGEDDPRRRSLDYLKGLAQ